jgi:metal-responsive CopG/Arc/MetJ family transcriptional regulator
MAKTKVSVTIERSLLERIDRLTNGISRSEIVERALKRWLHERRLDDLEEQIAAYYQELGTKEADEDRAWAELAAGQIRKTWR